jgi:ubiquinone/menaquinone biosynthesis C-methylase UbiE
LSGAVGASFIFRGSIREAQTHYLKQVPANAKVLVIGGGTGWWLKQLQTENPNCEIWFIEASTEMLHKAGENSKGNLILIHGTEENIPAIQFDVIITYFFLDLFDKLEIKRVINQINASLKNEGVWLVSDFVDTKFWHRVFLSMMYCFFFLIGSVHTTRLSSWIKNLEEVNLKCTHQVFFYRKFITACVYRKTKTV